MLNFANIENYKENNRIEAKKALGGLPKSIWETYSAFANTHGGIILLGVEEYRDKTFHTVDLPYPHEMVEEFLSLIEKMTNVNILRDGDVSVEKVDGKHIIAIRVPRAHRHDKPVYIGSDPLTGTYRRNGEGDYRCTNDEVRTMIRDSKSESLDMAVITRFTEDSLNIASIDKYISQMETSMPLSYCDKLELLLSVGAVVKDENGICHPTSAGLLMFGKKEALISEFKNFSAVFRNHKTGEVYSADNLFDFFMHVTPKLGEVLQVLKGKDSHSELFYCAREALINCLTNADFRESGAVNVTCSKKSITFSNPGDFRIDPEKARHGGVSDSRNCAIAEIFSNINQTTKEILYSIVFVMIKNNTRNIRK